MTDKQLIKTLENISSYCDNQRNCGLCKFNVNFTYFTCQIMRLVKELSKVPGDWDMKRIGELINEQTRRKQV